MCEFKVFKALGDLVAPVKAERLPPSVLLNVTAWHQSKVKTCSLFTVALSSPVSKNAAAETPPEDVGHHSELKKTINLPSHQTWASIRYTLVSINYRVFLCAREHAAQCNRSLCEVLESATSAVLTKDASTRGTDGRKRCFLSRLNVTAATRSWSIRSGQCTVCERACTFVTAARGVFTRSVWRHCWFAQFAFLLLKVMLM